MVVHIVFLKTHHFFRACHLSLAGKNAIGMAIARDIAGVASDKFVPTHVQIEGIGFVILRSGYSIHCGIARQFPFALSIVCSASRSVAQEQYRQNKREESNQLFHNLLSRSNRSGSLFRGTITASPSRLMTLS